MEPKNTPVYLFVYGTLMQNSGHEMHAFLAAHSIFIDDGWFNGLLFEVETYPGAVLSDDTQNKVYGQVFELTNPNQIFEILDAYEGIDPTLPEPDLFIRQNIKIFLNNQSPLQAWVYLYNLSTTSLKRIPSGKYLNS